MITAQENRGTRFNGLLERSYPEISPLPPTPITDEARDTLENWGMSEAFIYELQHVTSSFRYDLCDLKASRIAAKGGILFFDNNTNSRAVLLPDIFDGLERGDGQCSDITIQLMSALYRVEYFKRLQQHIASEWSSGNLRDEYPKFIFPIYSQGQSRTHFSGKNANHVWLGLSREISDMSNDMVVVDGSFQEISHLASNGYMLNKIDSIRDPPGLCRNLDGFVKMGSMMGYPDGRVQIEIPDRQFIIGSSRDKIFVYQLSFLINRDSEGITPMIGLVPMQNHMKMPLCYLDKSGNEVWLNDSGEVQTQHRTEVLRILTSMSRLQLEDNQEKAENRLSQTWSIQYR